MPSGRRARPRPRRHSIAAACPPSTSTAAPPARRQPRRLRIPPVAWPSRRRVRARLRRRHPVRRLRQRDARRRDPRPRGLRRVHGGRRVAPGRQRLGKWRSGSAGAGTRRLRLRGSEGHSPRRARVPQATVPSFRVHLHHPDLAGARRGGHDQRTATRIWERLGAHAERPLESLADANRIDLPVRRLARQFEERERVALCETEKSRSFAGVQVGAPVSKHRR